MMHRALVSLACAVVCSGSTVLRGRAALRTVSLSLETETSDDWAAYAEAESEDRNFLLTILGQTEDELVKLQQFLEASGSHTGVLAGLQISAAPVNKTAAVKPAVKAPEAKKEKAAVATTVAKKDAAKVTDPAAVMASLHLPSLKGKAALAPMLAMLKGLYEDSKDRISQQNTREEKSKKWFAEKEAEHSTKLAKIEGKFKNGTLSEEFRTNETRDETRYFNYWSRCRERQHRQFHTNLKIQHAMMMKTKKMIDMYEKTLSGKTSDQEAAKHQLAQASGGMPEIVFLQEMHHAVSSFCKDSLAEVRKEEAELKKWSKEGVAW